MSTNKSFSNKSSRQLLTVSEHPPAFAGFLFSLSSFRSSPIYPFFEVRLSACILSDHSSSGSIALLSAPTAHSHLFLSSYCPPPLAAARLLLTGHPLPTIQTPSNGTNSLKRYKLPQTVQTLPNGTTSPKRLIHLFCPQHSLKTKIAIEF